MIAIEPRPGVLDIEPYVGGESTIPGATRIIKLASNESALGPSPAAIAAYSGLSGALEHYPDGPSTALRAGLAAAHGVDPDCIVCGAGSDELLALLARAYAGPGDEVLYSQHGFLVYRLAALGVGAKPVAAPETSLTADVDALLAHAGASTRIVYLANPNNPTGTYLSAAELARLRAGLPEHTILVIDSAYAEYVGADDYGAGIDLVEAHDNVVTTRTFSKIYGLAALRLGWAYCPPAIADVLNRIRSPFNVTAPAQVAGLAAVSDTAHLAAARAHNDRWIPWLGERLRALGIEVVPSVANFILARIQNDKGGAPAADHHLRADGIIVRRMEVYGLPEYLRITVGPQAACGAVVESLARFME